MLQDVESYIVEAERQLSDKSFYKKVPVNPTREHEALICNAIDNLKQKELLDPKIAEKLKPTDSKKTQIVPSPENS